MSLLNNKITPAAQCAVRFSKKRNCHLLCVAALNLHRLLELLLVVEGVRRRLRLLKLHDVVGESLALRLQELASSALDILAPVWLLHVLGSRYEVEFVCHNLDKALMLLVVD